MKAVYVGSFNPVTYGHLEVATTALMYAEDVIFVPVSDYYNKTSLTVSALHRIEMLKRALKNPKFKISRIEVDSTRQYKTIETLTFLKNVYHEELMLVIGADNLKEISRWYQAEELLKTYYLLVFNRNEDLKQIVLTDPLLAKYQERIHLVNDFDKDISSEQVRKLCKMKQSIEEYVPTEVASYIYEHKLYQE